MRRWDLHVHTQWSDGSTPVREAVRYAARIGLAGIAVTDHDAMEMVPYAKDEGEKLGVEVIDGAEISAADKNTGRRVHILVYCPRDKRPLEPLFEQMAKRRYEAGEKMLDLLIKRFPITREMVYEQAKNSKTIYKTHLMRAVMELGFSLSIYGELYNELFGSNGCCKQRIEYPDAEQVALAAQKSGGVVILAHPQVYDSFETAERLATMGLIDGIENSYPRKTADTAEMHERIIKKYGLITTGGTDYHGYYTTAPHPLGSCTADETQLDALKALLEEKRKN